MADKKFEEYSIDQVMKSYQNPGTIHYNATERDLQLQINKMNLAFNILTEEIASVSEAKFDRQKFAQKVDEAFSRTFDISGVAIITRYN